MQISQVVIHEIKKKATETKASLVLSNFLVDVLDQKVINLISELDKRYKNKNERYSNFNKVETTVFYDKFEIFNKNKIAKDFVDFSKDSTTDLKKRIEPIQAAKGGYLVFAEYESYRRFLAVFLVRNTTSLSFSDELIDEQFGINLVNHVDVENLAMACRINLQSFETNETRCLSFINSNSDDAQFFIRWISADETGSNEEDSKQLLKLLKIIPTPIDKVSGESIQRESFLSNVYKVITASPNKIVNLKTLSSEFYENEDYIPNFAVEKNFTISHEFKGHSLTFKKLIQISAKADDIELSFPMKVYRNKVRIDENNPNQIIIDSEKLALEISSQLKNDY